MIKYIINWIFLGGLFFLVFLLSTENKSLMVLNIFPIKMGIEMPVYLYTIILAFISFIMGILANKVYNKTTSFKNKKDF